MNDYEKALKEKENRGIFKKLMKDNELSKRKYIQNRYVVYKDNDELISYITLDDVENLKKAIQHYNDYKPIKDKILNLRKDFLKKHKNIQNYITFGTPSISLFQQPETYIRVYGKSFGNRLYSEQVVKEAEKRIQFFETLKQHEKIKFEDSYLVYGDTLIIFEEIDEEKSIETNYQEKIERDAEIERRARIKKKYLDAGFFTGRWNARYYFKYEDVWLSGKQFYQLVDKEPQDEKNEEINRYKKNIEIAKEYLSKVEKRLKEGLKFQGKVVRVIMRTDKPNYIQHSVEITLKMGRKTLFKKRKNVDEMEKELRTGGYLND